MTKLILSTLFAVLFAFNSHADVIFEMIQKDFNPEAENKSDGKVKGNNFKMDLYEQGKLVGTMIYRGDKKEMVMISHEDKSYFVLDQEKLKVLAEAMKQAMAELDAALESMPPDQREQMKEMMKSRMPGTGEEYVEPVLKKAGNGKAGGYSCTFYDVYRGDVKVRQHCVAPWSKIEGGEEMKTVMTEMASFMDEMAEAFSSNSGFMGAQIQSEQNIFNKLKELNGFPVQTKDFKDGSIDSESTVTSTKKTDLTSSEFEPPADYKLQDMDIR